MFKAVSAALILILSGSLFAAGALGSDGCGMKCCCQTAMTPMQPAVEKQMRSPMGCCSGVPLRPCDIQSAKPLELPEIILAASFDNLPKVGGAPVVVTDIDHKRLNSGARFLVQVLDLKFNSPPLYLQNLSLLI